jgi:hypothetical protein
MSSSRSSRSSRSTRSSQRLESPHWAAADPGFGFDIVDPESDPETGEDSEGQETVRVTTVEEEEAKADEDTAEARRQELDGNQSVSGTDDGMSDGSSVRGTGESIGLPNLNQLVQLTTNHCRASCRISVGNRKVSGVCGGTRDRQSKSFCKRHVDKRENPTMIHNPGWYQAIEKPDGTFWQHGLANKCWTTEEIQRHEDEARNEMTRAASAFEDEDDDHSTGPAGSVGRRVSFGHNVSTPTNQAPAPLAVSAGSTTSSFHTAQGDASPGIREMIRELLQQELGVLRESSPLSSSTTQSAGRHSTPESTDHQKMRPEAMPKFVKPAPPPIDTGTFQLEATRAPPPKTKAPKGARRHQVKQVEDPSVQEDDSCRVSL